MANATAADIAYQNARLASLDVQESAYRALLASGAVDAAGLRDLSMASARAANEVARLSGPSGRD